MPSLRSRFPMELGSVSDPEAQLGRLHRLALAGGPGWGLTRLLRRGEGSFSSCSYLWGAAQEAVWKAGLQWASHQLCTRHLLRASL